MLGQKPDSKPLSALDMAALRFQEIKDALAEENPDALFADGFEGALIGIARRCGQPSLALYSYQKCVDILCERDGMSLDEAEEWMDFNVVGAWVGEHTPVWLTMELDHA